MKRILLSYYLSDGLQELNSRFGDFEYEMPETTYFSKDEILERIEHFDVFVPSFKFYIDKEIIDRGKKLELISNIGVGFDNIDVAYAHSKNIVVCNTPNSVLEPTAEFALALMYAICRKTSLYDRQLRRPEGLKWGFYSNMASDLFGKTLGIVGMGRIGQAIARRAVASGMKIVYHNRRRLDSEIENLYNARYLPFDELLSVSDVISLNAPLTEAMYHLFNRETFSKMKSTAYFVNTARGGLVNEEELAACLREGVIAGAALDVFENEPKINPNLLTLDNVVLAPHAGTATYEARRAMVEEMIHNIIGFYDKDPNISIVKI